MATFLIETYLSAARVGELQSATTRLRAAIGRASSRDGPVRLVRSFYVPRDELAFHLVEARSIEQVAEVSREANLTPERIVEAEAG